MVAGLVQEQVQYRPHHQHRHLLRQQSAAVQNGEEKTIIMLYLFAHAFHLLYAFLYLSSYYFLLLFLQCWNVLKRLQSKRAKHAVTCRFKALKTY